MEIIYKKGNLLDATTDIIAHQVNCQGVMGSGVAKQIKEKWPVVFNQYRSVYETAFAYNMSSDRLLGTCQLVDINGTQCVANLFGQINYGRDHKRYTNYDAVYNALTELAVQMMSNGMESVAFPYKMSSDRGGADWNVILAMIESVFEDIDITIEIWKL